MADRPTSTSPIESLRRLAAWCSPRLLPRVLARAALGVSGNASLSPLLALLVPAAAFTGTLLAEPYAYPAFLLAVVLGVGTLTEPTRTGSARCRRRALPRRRAPVRLLRPGVRRSLAPRRATNTPRGPPPRADPGHRRRALPRDLRARGGGPVSRHPRQHRSALRLLAGPARHLVRRERLRPRRRCRLGSQYPARCSGLYGLARSTLPRQRTFALLSDPDRSQQCSRRRRSCRGPTACTSASPSTARRSSRSASSGGPSRVRRR